MCKNYTLDCQEEKMGCKGCYYNKRKTKRKKIIDKNLVKIKEYDKFVLFENKKTGLRECILKIDL